MGEVETGRVPRPKVDKPVVVPAQYANHADTFNKQCPDVLLEHSQHNLAIETEANKVPLFGLMYDHSRLELNIL